MQVVVCGAGIIGASITYYLAKRGVRCTVVERCSPACAASGKAGGFLARDWCDQNEIGPLARLSYDLHAQLASEFGADIVDYRQVDALSVLLREGSTKRSHQGGDVPSWLDGIIGKPEFIGSKETTAQVHPFKLTNALLEAAAKMVDSRVRCAVVTGVATEAGRVVGVNLDSGDVIPADAVVLAMGPWTGLVSRWSTSLELPITGDPVHSVVLKPEAVISAHMLFTRYQTGTKNTDPEVYPRPDGTVYVCGQGSKPSLPDDPADITSNEADAKMLRGVAESASSLLVGAGLVASNCCYLPSTPDGLPFIGRVPNVDGLYVAAGHNCWGILEGPGTGACLAELIVDGSCSLLDLSPFDPSRAASG